MLDVGRSTPAQSGGNPTEDVTAEKDTPAETLISAERRAMDLSFFFEQREVGPQQSADASTIMTTYRQPAAPLGAITCEGRNDDVTAAAYRSGREASIGLLVGRLVKKMQHGPVVP